MRLVDADKLKEEFDCDVMGGLNYARILSNAETVNSITSDTLYSLLEQIQLGVRLRSFEHATYGRIVKEQDVLNLLEIYLKTRAPEITVYDKIKGAYNRGFDDGMQALKYHLEMCAEESEGEND